MSAGSLEAQLHWLKDSPPSTRPEVLVIGDSRIAEGFSSSIATSSTDGRLNFRNFGLSGTTPRVWYYMLRAADPTRRRFAAIAIALGNYSDEDWFAGFDDRATDQSYLVMRLGLGDCLDFALSMHSMTARHHAFFGCLFRGMILRSDVQTFLKNPSERMAHAADWLKNGLAYTDAYGGMTQDLRGISADWKHRTLRFPDGVPEATRANVRMFVMRQPVAQTGEVARYRQRWLGGILNLYRDSPTRLIFLQLPRAPLIDPHAAPGPSRRFVDEAARSPRVDLLPARTFEDLERPEMFADGLHLNRAGRPIFSVRLAKQVDALLGKEEAAEMLFTTLNFCLFLAVVLALFYALPKPARRYLLLAASLFFYMAWIPKYVLILLLLITIDYSAALWIESREGARRHAALIVSLAANIGLLGWFKYANFLRDTWLALIHGGPAAPLAIILPLGISFHTFQSMSYVIDVYRKKQPAIRSYVDYALFVSFFPQLVAGPIVRAEEFFADYFHWRPPTAEEWRRACAMILTGYIKKLVCADQFSLVADRYFANPGALPGLLPAWSGALAFGLQIFFDFSGYTDIAIGIALLFGFHFPENFRRPYLSASVTEFWRRWHITLSSWLRDYVYISLGGNRKGAWRTRLNLMLTMLLGGLWHGASWNFVIWGGYHGVLLSIERLIWGKKPVEGLARIPLGVVTFLLVTVGWVFFRAKTFAAAIYVIGQMFTGGTAAASLLGPWQVRLALFTLVLTLAEEYGAWVERLAQSSLWVRTAAAVAALLIIELFTATDLSIPFVYFQF